MNPILTFLSQLTDNNNRPWFEANRPLYETLRAQWLADLERIIAAMTAWEPSMASQTAKGCTYRIYRDTRFSLDKTPYKSYFSAAFSPWGRKSERAGFYLEMSPDPDRCGLYAGIWCVQPTLLKKLRHAIVDNIEEWQQILDTPDRTLLWPDWCSSTLKTIPKGWQRNHPQAFYLRMTNYGLLHPLTPEFFSLPDWPEAVAATFRAAKPFVDFLNYSIDE